MPQTLNQQFREVFGKYLKLNKRMVSEIATQKAGQLAFNLHRGTYQKRAKRAKIAADVRKQGWALRVPKTFRDRPEFKRKPGEPNSEAALARFQAAVTNARARGIGFISVGWLAATKRLGVATRTNVRAEKILGECLVFIHGSVAKTVMTNSTPGVQTLFERYPIAAEAVKLLIVDMQKYIDAKMRGVSGKRIGGV